MKYSFEFYDGQPEPDDNSEYEVKRTGRIQFLSWISINFSCEKAIRKFKELYLYSERPLTRNPITQRDLALCQFAFMG